MRIVLHCIILSCLVAARASAFEAALPRRGLEYARTLIPVTYAASVVWADVNGDSTLDAAVASGSDTVHVLLGRGARVYEPADRLQFFTSGQNVRVVSAVDQDGDGVLDLVVRRSSTAWVAFGRGDGTFSLGNPAFIEGDVLKWCAADIDGDGLLDFVGMHLSEYALRVHIGTRDGTFRDVGTLPLSPNLNWGDGQVLAADFDGDGLTDIIATATNPVSTARLGVGFWNLGGLSFLGQSLSPPLQLPQRLAVFDYEGDGASDLVGFSLGMIAVYRFAGRAPTSVRAWLPNVGLETAAVGRADLDGDGHPDLVYTNRTAVHVAWGPDDGAFADVSVFSLPGAEGVPTIVDVDHDGALDIVASAGTAGLKAALGVKGARRLLAAPIVSGVTSSSGVSVADLDGDSRPDLVVDDSGAGQTSVVLRDDSGGFRPGTAIPARAAKLGPPIVADLDGDGLADLAVTGGSGPDSTAVLFGDGSGGFGGGRLDLTAGRPVGIVRAEGGGTPSLAVRTSNEVRLVPISRHRQAEVQFVTACGQDDAVFAVDLAPDGGSDIVTAARDSNATVLRRSVSGWAELGRTASPGATILGAVALESDPGVPRYLVTWNEYGYRIYDAAAGGEMPWMGGGRPGTGHLMTVQTPDVDCDGLRDLAIVMEGGYNSPSSVIVQRHRGDGTLEGYAAGAAAHSYGTGLGTGDLDGDGWPEFLIVSEGGIAVLRNVEATSTVRMVAIPPVAHQQPLVRAVVTVEPSLGKEDWILSVLLDGLLIDRWQGSMMRTIPLPFPLMPGTHEVRVHLADPDVGDNEASAIVEVRPRTPRRMLPRPPRAGQ